MRRILLLMTLLIFGLSIQAEDEIRLSYCRGTVAARGSLKLSASVPADVAIYVPGTMLRSYGGNAVKAVRVGLASTTNVETLKVWIRKSLEGDDVTSQDVDISTIKKGWTTVSLSTPYAISSDDDGIYIGYTITQSAVASNVSVADQIHDNGYFRRVGDDGAWQDYHTQGAVSIEGVVRGDNIPQYDLGILSATYKIAGGQGTAKAEIRNGALNDVEGFEVTLNVFGVEQDAVGIDNFVQSGDNTNITVPFTIPEGGDSAKGVTLAITKLTNATDNAPQNDTATATRTYQRRTVVEEFSTEACTNCPRVSAYMYDVMDREEFSGQVFAVVHHVAYGTDFLTRDGDDAYLWFFNNNGNTYAPALMYDRCAYFSTEDGNTTPCVNPGSADEIATVFRARLQQDAAADLNVSAQYTSEAKDEVEVTVKGERGREFSVSPARITVYLTEDSIKAHDQHGTDDPNYYHQHTLRAANSTWGDVIEWNDDNHFTYTTTLAVDPTWRKEIMHIVAFINRYDSTDPSQGTIENAASITFDGLPVAETPTGISSPEVRKTSDGASFYDISGRHLAQPSKGINIIRYSDGTTRKAIVK